MDPVLSVAAVAQNTAFVDAIKGTETVRDRPLQISHRVGGGITIDGYRSVRFSKLLPIFMQYGKKFTISFPTAPSTSVKLDCFELVEHIIPTDIDTLGGQSKLSEVLCVILNGNITNTTASGAIHCFSFSLNKIDYKTALSLYQHASILDIVFWPDRVDVETIKQSDNKGGLSYLVQTKPELFRRKCPPAQQPRDKSSQTSTKRARVMKRTGKQKKKSFFASLLWN